MCLEDIPIKDFTKDCVIIYNGSELILVSIFSVKRNSLSYQHATYTLARAGGTDTTYNTGDGRKIYTIPLISSSREIVTVRAFSVENILTEKI